MLKRFTLILLFVLVQNVHAALDDEATILMTINSHVPLWLSIDDVHDSSYAENAYTLPVLTKVKVIEEIQTCEKKKISLGWDDTWYKIRIVEFYDHPIFGFPRKPDLKINIPDEKHKNLPLLKPGVEGYVSKWRASWSFVKLSGNLDFHETCLPGHGIFRVEERCKAYLVFDGVYSFLEKGDLIRYRNTNLRNIDGSNTNSFVLIKHGDNSISPMSILNISEYDVNKKLEPLTPRIVPESDFIVGGKYMATFSENLSVGDNKPGVKVAPGDVIQVLGVRRSSISNIEGDDVVLEYVRMKVIETINSPEMQLDEGYRLRKVGDEGVLLRLDASMAFKRID